MSPRFFQVFFIHFYAIPKSVQNVPILDANAIATKDKQKKMVTLMIPMIKSINHGTILFQFHRMLSTSKRWKCRSS